MNVTENLKGIFIPFYTSQGIKSADMNQTGTISGVTKAVEIGEVFRTALVVAATLAALFSRENTQVVIPAALAYIVIGASFTMGANS